MGTSAIGHDIVYPCIHVQTCSNMPCRVRTCYRIRSRICTRTPTLQNSCATRNSAGTSSHGLSSKSAFSHTPACVLRDATGGQGGRGRGGGMGAGLSAVRSGRPIIILLWPPRCKKKRAGAACTLASGPGGACGSSRHPRFWLRVGVRVWHRTNS